jgi:hypothetical protein
MQAGHRNDDGECRKDKVASGTHSNSLETARFASVPPPVLELYVSKHALF